MCAWGWCSGGGGVPGAVAPALRARNRRMQIVTSACCVRWLRAPPSRRRRRPKLRPLLLLSVGTGFETSWRAPAAVEKVPQCVSATLILFLAPPPRPAAPVPPPALSFSASLPLFVAAHHPCLAPQPRRDGCARHGVRARHGQQCDHLQPAQCPGLVPCPQRQGSALAACIRRQVRAPRLEQGQENQLGHHADVVAGMPVL
jgi:hypothetical protein